ncbi:unnamed protein product, partial [Rotaria sp. Silwood1]
MPFISRTDNPPNVAQVRSVGNV